MNALLACAAAVAPDLTTQIALRSKIIACTARIHESINTRQFMYARITTSSQCRVVGTELHAVIRVEWFCLMSNSNLSFSFNNGWNLRGRQHEAQPPVNPTIKEGGWVPGGWYPV